ncbi:MAG: transposase [Candidatus Omnitrophica bacterium]|nr:transposase [Candidatus Omnitrophota bacterium]
MPGDRKSIRLKDYDYAQTGGYDVSICAHGDKCIFGVVKNGEMFLSDCGKIVDKCWNEIPEHFPHVELDEHIVMPNHMHGIIVIGGENDDNNVGAGFPRPDNETAGKGRGNRAPTLGQIVAYFKYGSTKQINAMRNTPGARLWQRNFYEHVIRNEPDLNRVREYIVYNPAKWEEDEYYAQVDCGT